MQNAHFIHTLFETDAGIVWLTTQRTKQAPSWRFSACFRQPEVVSCSSMPFSSPEPNFTIFTQMPVHGVIPVRDPSSRIPEVVCAWSVFASFSFWIECSRCSRATTTQRENQVKRRAAFQLVLFGGLVVGPALERSC
jgi:hypothetical protein